MSKNFNQDLQPDYSDAPDSVMYMDLNHLYRLNGYM